MKRLLLLYFFAFEEQEGNHMGDEVHLGDCLGRCEELREGLLIAAHSFVEIGAGVHSFKLGDHGVHELLRGCLHAKDII